VIRFAARVARFLERKRATTSLRRWMQGRNGEGEMGTGGKRVRTAGVEN